MRIIDQMLHFSGAVNLLTQLVTATTDPIDRIKPEAAHSPATASTIEQRMRAGSSFFSPWWLVIHKQKVDRPLDEVFEFFSNAENLERLTPSFLNFEILSPLPIQMRVGARIAYKLKLWGVTLRWLTLIEAWDPPQSFVDTQIRGPYQRWHHLHQFESTADGGTLMTDKVELQVPLGPLGVIAYYAFVRRSLDEIFRYRAAVLERLARYPHFQEPVNG
jgi:ligand-binding SRPBCC domain-containing protein